MRITALALLLVASALAVPGAAEARVPADRAEIGLSFAPVVKSAAPAVVNIYASRIVAQRLSPFAGDPFFSQFFDFGQTVPRVQNSLGSGVILSADGTVFDGLAVAALGPALIERLGLPLTAEGVVVTEVAGSAHRTRLRPGDILIAVNGIAIRTPDDLVAAAAGRVRT